MENTVHSGKRKKFLHRLVTLLKKSRNWGEIAIHAELVGLYWKMGKLMRREWEKLRDQRREAFRGEEKWKHLEGLLQSIKEYFQQNFGPHLSEKNLRAMIDFAEKFPEEKILPTEKTLNWQEVCEINLFKIFLLSLKNSKRQRRKKGKIGSGKH